MTTATTSPSEDNAHLIRIAWVLIVGALAVIFDTTIVGVALRTLAQELDTSVDVIQWVSTAYLLALGVTVPLVGWAQRRIGGKRLWILSKAIFLFGSILCSLAWDAPSLITFRVIQGIGGGIMMPLMSTLVMQAAGGKNLGSLMSLIGLPAVLGPVLGPVLGGIILNSFHWSFLFWVNIPFCVVGIALALKYLPNDGPTKATPLDVVGLLLLSPSIVGLLYGLSNTSKDGGLTRFDVYGPVIAGAILLAAFIMWSLAKRGAALIDIRLFRHWPLASSSMMLFFSGVSLYGALFLLPLFLQETRGTDALGAGLLMIPQGLGTFASRTFAGRISDRIGPRWVAIVGFGIVLIGTIPFAFMDGATSEIPIIITLFVRGFGLGAVTIPIMALAFVGLERTQMAEASIITRIASQIGGSFGTAVFAVILASTASADGTTSGVSSFHQAFWWSTAFTAIAVVLGFLLPGRPAPDPVPSTSAATPATAR